MPTDPQSPPPLTMTTPGLVYAEDWHDHQCTCQACDEASGLDTVQCPGCQLL